MRLGHTHRSSGCSSWMNELSSVHDRFGYSVTVSLERVKIQAFKSRGFANYLFLCPEIHKSNSATRSKWILQARKFWSFQHPFWMMMNSCLWSDNCRWISFFKHISPWSLLRTRRSNQYLTEALDCSSLSKMQNDIRIALPKVHDTLTANAESSLFG